MNEKIKIAVLWRRLEKPLCSWAPKNSKNKEEKL